ncbi:hypothetical protein NEFER03_0282 [Nematocida sp. LUAm3]|nr:hypothetical protein NEFER03_0282 [Nematocida sp. LUAm3]KAI5173734.1 hypothetical protein NEFER02_0250 [Nematocida sp. LUAm2]KAI5176957.1 hypothetical protein NEFER01_0282 [Nematocida sp. LUAm1]
MECKWSSCRETFGDQKEFSGHVNKHVQDSDAKTCHWEECSKTTGKKIGKGALLAHMRMHTREKPFKCNLCTKEYSRSDALNKHIKAHDQIAADEDIHMKKLFYLTTVHQENEILLKDMQQQYRRLIVENEILLKRICSSIRRTRR